MQLVAILYAGWHIHLLFEKNCWLKP
jgi:hypothetical protein